MKIPAFLLVLFLALAPAAHAAARPVPLPDHWVGTWATASSSQESASVLADLGLGVQDLTLRQIVHVSLGGPLLRVTFTNEFGTEPLTLGAAHLALATPTSSTAGDIALASANALTFGGKSSITIPAGGTAVSDPASITVPAGGNLVITLFVPAQKLTHASFHSSAYQTGFLAAGNLVGARSLPTSLATTTSPASPRRVTSWYFLKGVDVFVPAEDGAIVAFGDSITDGTATEINANNRWPDFLARRLQAGKRTRSLGVLNEGIGGNRILHDGTGPSALARFDRDVLAHPGVKYLILLEGINDIGHAYDPARPFDVVTADDLIQGLAQLAERAHEHGIQVIGATLTPYTGATYASPAGEQVRQTLNTWIRTTRLFDGVVDFDKATSDPAHPAAFNPAYDLGDHLHPKDAGMKAMADAFDLSLFDPHKKEKYDIHWFKD